MWDADLAGVAMKFAVAGEAGVATAGPRPRPAPGRPGGGHPDPLRRLVEIARSNDLLLAQLAEARRRTEQAEGFAADARARVALGSALVAHARRRRSEILVRLAANRREAVAILAGGPAAG